MYFSDQIAKELQRIKLGAIRPCAPLRPYIQCFWIIDAELTTAHSENFYPDGGSGLIFNFGDSFQIDGQQRNGAFLQGIGQRAEPVTFLGKTATLGVHFMPGGASAFKALPVLDQHPSLIPLDMVSKDYDQLFQQLGELPDMMARVHRLEAAFLARLEWSPYDSLVAKARSQLFADSAARSIEALAGALGCSARHLQRVFRCRVGITPVALARFFRVLKLRQLLKQHSRSPLAQMGLEAGYFDQAHFIREFKRVAGLTPLAYRRRAQVRYMHHQNGEDPGQKVGPSA